MDSENYNDDVLKWKATLAGIIPHTHECEIKMVKREYWKKYCPHNGEISSDEGECDLCNHLIIVEYWGKEMTIIRSILR